MHNVSVVLFCNFASINCHVVVYSIIDKPFVPSAFVKEKASERAHQDRSSPLRSIATKMGATIVAMEERTDGEGEAKGRFGGLRLERGRRIWCVGVRLLLMSVGGAEVMIVTDSPLGAMCVRGPFLSFLGFPTGSGRGPLPIFGCVLWTASQPTVAG